MYEKYKNAVVTGAARGIGKAIALKLASKGLNVVVSDVLEDELRATAKELEALGVKSLPVKTDVSKKDDVVNLIKTTVEEFGSIDFLINNAGITRDCISVRMTEEEWDIVMNVNLKGTFLCSRFAAKEMMKNRFGRIVNMASISGILGTPGQANYASSKAGVIALTKSFARELGRRNITVNAIAPGFILTEMTEKLPDKVKEEYIADTTLKRAGTPDDIAEVVSFLISPSASYITGTVINVSGGLLI
jgi:3-oxoacyl-[acyl-carrier protein] reductase